MALYHHQVVILFLLLAVTSIEASGGVLLKGSVTCLDCDDGHIHDLSGIKVLVKCRSKDVKKRTATTSKDGSFETKLIPNGNNINPLKSCSVKILGGSTLLFKPTANNNIAAASGSKLVKVVDIHGGADYYYYTNSEPLNFYKSCPVQKYEKCSEIIAESINDDDQFGSAKTVDFPFPREWGLAPTSFYLPFIPIIGIP